MSLPREVRVKALVVNRKAVSALNATSPAPHPSSLSSYTLLLELPPPLHRPHILHLKRCPVTFAQRHSPALRTSRSRVRCCGSPPLAQAQGIGADSEQRWVTGRATSVRCCGTSASTMWPSWATRTIAVCGHHDPGVCWRPSPRRR